MQCKNDLFLLCLRRKVVRDAIYQLQVRDGFLKFFILKSGFSLVLVKINKLILQCLHMYPTIVGHGCIFQNNYKLTGVYRETIFRL